MGSNAMSALGQKQTCAVQNGMSALPPKADMCGANSDVRFRPIADIGVSTTFRLTFVGRVRNGLFASIAHIGEMVFQAGLDTAAPGSISAQVFSMSALQAFLMAAPFTNASWQRKEKSLKRVLTHAMRPSPLCPAH